MPCSGIRAWRRKGRSSDRRSWMMSSGMPSADLEVAIRKIGASVEIGPLPIVKGDPNQLRQLFQNLIANAVKYHRSEVRP